MHLNFPGLFFILLLVPYAALPQAKKPIVVSKCRRTRAKPSWDVRIQPWFIGSDLVNRVVSRDAGSCVSSSLFSFPPCFQLLSLSHACVANTFANCVGHYLHFGFGLVFFSYCKTSRALQNMSTDSFCSRLVTPLFFKCPLLPFCACAVSVVVLAETLLSQIDSQGF